MQCAVCTEQYFIISIQLSILIQGVLDIDYIDDKIDR